MTAYPRLAHVLAATRTAPLLPDEPACYGRGDMMSATRGRAAAEALALCQQCPLAAFQACRRWVDQEPDYTGVAAGKIYTAARAQEAAA